MRIAFIVRQFPAMSESFVLKQIVGLLDCGHDVQIFAELDPRQDSVHDDVLKYDLKSRTRYISTIPRNKLLCRLKTLFLTALAFFRGPVKLTRALSLNIKRGRKFSYTELYFVFLFLGRRFDIFQCHFGPAGRVGALLKQTGFKGKVVTAFHGYDVTSYVNQRGRNIYDTLFDVGDLFTYNSEATKQNLLTLGAPPERLVKLPMGIDVENITFSPRQLDPGQCVNILSVGRLVEMKGREYAVRAIARLVKKFENLSYTIVGDGKLRQPLDKLIDDLGVRKWIHLVGWVDDERLNELYKSSHIFLHPSITASDGNMEGQGVVLLEAQGYGMPVVATKHNAFVETVLDGQTGILAPERDVDMLAEALENLIENSDRWPQMGKAGREHVQHNYDIKTLNRQLVKIFEQLAAD
jgi:colanic acid/amylovoran biosynthesis glycosyltransferase